MKETQVVIWSNKIKRKHKYCIIAIVLDKLVDCIVDADYMDSYKNNKSDRKNIAMLPTTSSPTPMNIAFEKRIDYFLLISVIFVIGVLFFATLFLD
jgi:hypothetical protein